MASKTDHATLFSDSPSNRPTDSEVSEISLEMLFFKMGPEDDSVKNLSKKKLRLRHFAPELTFNDALRQLRLGDPNGEIARALEAYVSYREEEFHMTLKNLNLSSEEFREIMSFIDFRVEAEHSLHMVELSRREHSVPSRDTSQLGAAEDLAAALGVSTRTVRQRTAEGNLIALFAPDPDDEFPMFQAWPGIGGMPLESVLKSLGRPQGQQAYQFMTSPSEALGGLTPIEVLLGEAPPDALLAAGVRDFLKNEQALRLQAVQEVAVTFSAIRAGA